MRIMSSTRAGGASFTTPPLVERTEAIGPAKLTLSDARSRPQWSKGLANVGHNVSN